MTTNKKLGAEQARKIIEEVIWNWLNNPSPFHALFKCDTGLGKSTSTINKLALINELALLKAGGKPMRVLWLVPHHKLSNQALAGFQKAGINAAVQRGREAENPNNPGTKMCLNIEAVKAVQKMQGDVEKQVCGPSDPNKGPQCPFRNNCPYIQQRKTTKNAEVVIAAHNSLYNIGGLGPIDKFDLTIIDEEFTKAGTPKPIYQEMDFLIADTIAQPAPNAMHQLLLLGEIRKFQAVIDTMKHDDYLTGDFVRKHMSHIDFGTMADLEWDRAPQAQIKPGMTITQIYVVASQIVNTYHIARAKMWRNLYKLQDDYYADNLDAVFQVCTKQNDKGGIVTSIRINKRKNINDDILAMPILYLNATPSFEIAKSFIPNLMMLGDVQAETPHQHVTYVTGGFGKSSMTEKMFKEIQDFINALPKVNSDKIAVITHPEWVPHFDNLSRVQVATFGSTTGLNGYSEVDYLFVVGRTLSKPLETHTAAEAVFGKVIPKEENWTVVNGKITMRDGSIIVVPIRSYKDKMLQEVRYLTTDAPGIQNVGRARGVNRTIDKPVQVFICGDFVPDFVVDRVISKKELFGKKSRLEQMASRNAFLFSPQDAQRIYPDLFASIDIAKEELKSICPVSMSKVDFSTNILVEESTLLPLLGQIPLSLKYQFTGAGEKQRHALVRDADMFRKEIEQHGTLALFEVKMTEQERHIQSINELDIQSDVGFHLTKFTWKYGKDRKAIPGVVQQPRTRLAPGTGQYTWDELVELLKAESNETIEQKEKRHLWSAAFYGENATRSLANALAANVLIQDFDDGVATPEMLMRTIPHRMICTNTFTSSANKLKWRAYIPMSRFVKPETYRFIMEEINRMIAPAQMDDASFSVAQPFYAPCKPKLNPELAFFKVCNEPIFDPIHFIKQMTTVEPPAPLPVQTAPTVKQPVNIQKQIEWWIDDCQNASPKNHFKARQIFAGKINRLVKSGEIGIQDAKDLFDDMAKYFAMGGNEGYRKYYSDMSWVL